MLRVSHLHQESISIEMQEIVFQKVESALQNSDLLVFSDFNYGFLPQQMLNRILEVAVRHNTLMVADSQSSSQIGDISRYKSMDIITPTEREARISTRNHEDGLVILAETLRQQANAKNVLLKLGEEGFIIHASKDGSENFDTDQIPALNSYSKDVAGAGDSLLISSGMARASGANIWEAAFIGSLAAAIQVGRLGNIPLKLHELIS